jgi:hypothetical protein
VVEAEAIGAPDGGSGLTPATEIDRSSQEQATKQASGAAVSSGDSATAAATELRRENELLRRELRRPPCMHAHWKPSW